MIIVNGTRGLTLHIDTTTITTKDSHCLMSVACQLSFDGSVLMASIDFEREKEREDNRENCVLKDEDLNDKYIVHCTGHKCHQESVKQGECQVNFPVHLSPPFPPDTHFSSDSDTV